MYQSTRRSKFENSIILSMLGIIAASAFAPKSDAQEVNKENYDKTLQIEVKALDGYLKYPKSKMGDFYKVSVKSAEVDGSKEVPYEELYTCSKLKDQGALLACKRLCNLDIKKKRVALVFKFSSTSTKQEEIQCAAFSVAPLLLDLLLNENFAGAVYVPAEAFFAFKQALNNQGFQSSSQVTTANTALVSIQLQTTPAARSEALFYFPSLKK